MKFVFSLVFIFGSIFQVNKELSKKIITSDTHTYVFYVTSKKVSKYNNDKTYFCFKSGAIHEIQGGSIGEILHGDYSKSDTSNRLAEQGSFQYGLKHEIWKTWFPNGKLKSILTWKRGNRSGKYKEFDENGAVVITGKYLSNAKHGKWILHQTKDTLYFNKGIKVTKEVEIIAEKKSNKENVFTKIKKYIINIFKKKTPEEKAQKELEKQKKEQQKELALRRKKLAEKKKAAKKKNQKASE